MGIFGFCDLDIFTPGVQWESGGTGCADVYGPGTADPLSDRRASSLWNKPLKGSFKDHINYV